MVLRDITPAQEDSLQVSDFSRVVSQLSLEFDAEPIQDGMSHPADAIVESHLGLFVAIDPVDLLSALAEQGPLDPSSVMRSLGRCEYPWTTTISYRRSSKAATAFVDLWQAASWRHALIETSLRTGNILLRDAAVQAVEEWEDSSLLPLLDEHRESEPWLQNYIDQVISDLT